MATPKGDIMRGRVVLIAFIIIAAGGLVRVSRQTRSVDAVGLFASGVLAGTAINRLVMAGRAPRA